MARLIAGVVERNGLMDQPLVVVNKAGGAGAEGFLEAKGAAGDPHKLVIALSNVFTTPLGTGASFSFKDLTPIAMIALDNFVLWVNAESPYQSAEQYIEAAIEAGEGAFRMAGTGTRQEDQIITIDLERQTGAKFTYVPFKSGGQVASELVRGNVDSTVSNPVEAVAHWRAGALRPLCVLAAERLSYDAKVTEDAAWSDIPTCRESDVDVEYQMLRGMFLPGEVPEEAVDYYLALLDEVRETPEWQELMEEGAFEQRSMSGAELAAWLDATEQRHIDLMTAAGFLVQH
jgi:tripartite-type tricarboxylate transporter receptor subunit TctC